MVSMVRIVVQVFVGYILCTVKYGTLMVRKTHPTDGKIKHLSKHRQTTYRLPKMRGF